MLTWNRYSSPSLIRAKLSRRLTRPSRIAFTSVPSSTRPASNVSRRWKSWKALRFSAMLDCAFSRSVFSAIVLATLKGRPTSVAQGFHLQERFGGPPKPWRRRSALRSCPPRGKQARRDHTLRIGHAFAGDVERRAVIDRRPDDGQAERHVDRLPERHELDRNQPLIVIARHDHVEVAAAGAHEDGVARERTGHLDAARAARLDRRPDRRLLFMSEQTMLARVRVQAGHRNPRPRDAESRQLARGEIDRRLERGGGQRPRDVGQRDV